MLKPANKWFDVGGWGHLDVRCRPKESAHVPLLDPGFVAGDVPRGPKGWGGGVDHYRALDRERQLRQAGEKTAESLRETERKTGENLQKTCRLAIDWESNARSLAIILNGKHGYQVTQEAHRDGVNLGIIYPPSTWGTIAPDNAYRTANNPFREPTPTPLPPPPANPELAD